ncbi:MAG TPA: DMT family transporter, partial [Ktedonobacteraceae bacterium]
MNARVQARPAVSEERGEVVPGQPAWFRDRAVWLGGLGVLCFSLTLPATHLAEPGFGSVVVGLGRALVAAALAGIVLLVKRERVPPRRTWAGLVCVAGGVVVGFPLFSALALEGTPVAHSAIISGLLPALTALGGVLRGGERPRALFWLSCGAGVLAVLLFAIVQG